MNKGLISVIIPMYNSEKFIQNCLKSVVNQTYKELEILVINDGSIDCSESIVRRMMCIDHRIKLISTRNKGVSAARNYGISVAKGDYIFFLDADDELPIDSFQSLIDCITVSKADIVVGRDVSYNEVGIISNISFTDSVIVWKGDESIIACLQDYPNTWNVCGKLFKKEVLIDIRFERGKIIGEDSYFFFLCSLKRPTVAYYDKCVYKVYMSNNSATRSPISEKKIEDIIEFSKMKEYMIDKYFPMYSNLVINTRIKAYLVILNGICKNYSKDFYRLEEEAKQYIIRNKNYYIKGYGNDRLFTIVTRHLYGIYKVLIRFKD